MIVWFILALSTRWGAMVHDFFFLFYTRILTPQKFLLEYGCNWFVYLRKCIIKPLTLVRCGLTTIIVKIAIILMIRTYLNLSTAVLSNLLPNVLFIT